MHRGLVGVNQRFLRVRGGFHLVVLFFGRDARVVKLLVARGLHLIEFGLRLVAREVRFGLRERGLKRPGVKREKQVTFVDEVALLEMHLLQDGVYLALDGNRRVGFRGADCREIDRNGFLYRFRYRHRNGEIRRGFRGLGAAGGEAEQDRWQNHGERGARESPLKSLRHGSFGSLRKVSVIRLPSTIGTRAAVDFRARFPSILQPVAQIGPRFCVAAAGDSISHPLAVFTYTPATF